MRLPSLSITFVSVAVLTAGMATSIQAETPKPKCTDSSRQCMIPAVKSYLDALEHHNRSLAPLAPNVRRTANGQRIYEGANAVGERIDREVTFITFRNVRFFVDEDQQSVIAFWLIGLNQPGPITSHIAERFKVQHGLITEIEGIIYNEEGTSQGKSAWPA